VACFTIHYLVALHHGCSVDPFAAAAAAFFPFISFLLSGFGRHELTATQFAYFAYDQGMHISTNHFFLVAN